MTARSMLDRLAAVIGARSDAELARRANIAASEISRIRRMPERGAGMGLSALKNVSDATGVPIGRLAEWWAEPEPLEEKRYA